MSSKIIASTTSGTALNMSADTSGILEIQTGSTPTTAITVDGSQNVGIGTSSPSTYGKFAVVATTDKDGINILFPVTPLGTNGSALNFWSNSNTALYKSGSIQNICTNGGSGGSSALTFNVSNAGTISEACRINSSSILLTNGLTSSPGQADSNSSGVGVAINTKLELRWNNTNAAIYGGAGGGDDNLYYYSGLNHIWRSNGSERMRIDSSGNLLVGLTTAGLWNANCWGVQTGSGFTVHGHINGTSTGTAYTYFDYNNSPIGSIGQSGTTGVSYNTTSDYRLKTDVAPIQNALATVEALNPVSFTWIDGRKDDGFLAHELQAVIPNCVTGEKDAINEDGTPKYQQMDNSGVIPFLVKAIQELNTKVDAQAAEIKALKGVA